jgi:hypothetical protein
VESVEAEAPHIGHLSVSADIVINESMVQRKDAKAQRVGFYHSLSAMEWTRGPGRGRARSPNPGQFNHQPLSSILSPLLRRGARKKILSRSFVMVVQRGDSFTPRSANLKNWFARIRAIRVRPFLRLPLTGELIAREFNVFIPLPLIPLPARSGSQMNQTAAPRRCAG